MEYKTAKRMESLPFSEIRAVMEKATKMQQAGENVIHLEIGRPDFEHTGKDQGGRLRESESGARILHFQLRNTGSRKEIAKWETEHHGVQYDADEVLCDSRCRRSHLTLPWQPSWKTETKFSAIRYG